MTMIEIVARALARNQLTALGKEAFDKDERYYTNCFSKEHRDEFEAQARLAIEAMREPTEEMREEGISTIILNSFDIGPTVIYQSMIDAALKE